MDKACPTNPSILRPGLILGILAVCIGAAIPALAVETLINTETSGNQNYPALAIDDTGNFVITWHSENQDGSGYGVYGQRFNSLNAPQGSEFLVNTFTTGDQGNTAVGMDTNGNFVVVWQSPAQDQGVSWGVYARRFLANGTPEGVPFQVNTTSQSDQALPAVAMAPAGNFVIVWQGNGSTDNYGIHARMYDSSGNPLASEFLVHNVTTQLETDPDVVMDQDGNFLVAWERSDTDGDGKGVYARRFNATGTAQGTEFLVNTTTASDQENASVAMDPGGDFVIVWEDLGADGSLEGIFARRFNALGTPQGDEFPINTTTSSNQQNPAICLDSSGNFLVTWESDGQDGSGLGIFGREFDSLGSPLGSEFQVNTTSTGAQATGHNSIIRDAGNNWLAGWYGQGSGDTGGVFFDTFSPSASADIQLVKTVDDATPNEGQTISYTVTVSNNGTSDATGITVIDALPAGVTYVSDTPSQGSYVSGTGIWTVGNVANSGTATLTLVATVDGGTAGSTVTNSASITAADQTDPVPGNNSDSTDITVSSTDLQIAKVVDNNAPNEGDTVTYTVTLTNAGPNDATGIAVTDLLPAGVTYLSDTPSQGSYVPGTGIWTVGNVANSGTATLTLVATVDGGTAGTTVTNNTAITAADQADPVSANNTSSAAIAVSSSDLQVTKVVDNNAPNEGDTVTYTVTLTNAGPNDATGIAVTDLLPAGVTYVSDTPSQGSYVSGTGIWTLGNVANSGTATLTLVASVDSGTASTTVTNSASITAANQTDPVPGNNSDSADLTVSSADLQIAKVVDNNAPNEGDTVTYTVTLTNAGPNDATGIAVSDLLPAGVTYFSDTPSQGSYVPGTGIWAVGNVANSGTATLTLVATVDGGTAGSIVTNNVAITAVDQADPVPANNTSSAGITVTSTDLQLAKVVDNNAPNEGDTVTYTVTLTNAGPNDATGITVTDLLPDGVTYVSDTPSQGSYVSGTGIWTLGNVANSGTATLTLVASVDSGTAGTTVTNSASITAVDQADPVPGNNSGSADITVSSADLQIAKVVDNNTPNEGDTVTYTVTLTNAGPNDATGIAVTDLLPAGVTYVSDTPSQGSYVSGTGIWTVGNVANAGTAALTLVATVDSGTAGTTVTNIVAITSADQADPATGNNTSQASVDISDFMGSISLTNIPLDADLLEPAGIEKPVLKFLLANLAAKADTLTALTVFNSSIGPGSMEELDNNWENLSLWIEIGSSLETPQTTSPQSEVSGTFEAGQLIFTDLAINIPVGQEVTLVILGQASLDSREGDLLAVSISGPSDFVFSSPTQFEADWPLETANPMGINGLVADQITVNDVGPDLFPQDSTRNLVLDIGIPSNGYEVDELKRLNIVNLGTASQGSDITVLEGWADDGDGLFDPEQDTPLGHFAFTGTRWELTGIDQAISLSGLRIFISIDISDEAGEGRSIQMALPTLPDVGIGTASGNDGPIDRAVANPYSQAISVSNRVLITSWAIEPGVVHPGDDDVLLLHIAASNTYDSERVLGTLTVTNSSTGLALPGSPELDGELANLSLRLDGNDDGILGTLTEDPVLGTGSFASGILSFSGMGWTLPAESTRHLFLTGDVSLSGSRDGDALSALIEAGSDLGFETPTAISASWPLDSGSAWSVDGMVAEQIANTPVPNLTLAASEGPALALDINIPRNGYEDDTLIGLTLVNLGTATATDLASLQLWRDGGDGFFTPGSGDDVSLGPLVPVSGSWSSPILNETITASSLRLFVGLTVAAVPTDASTVQLAVPVNGVTVASSNNGPIDQVISSPGTSLLSTAPLLANMEFEVNQSTVGRDVAVRMILRNVGGENLVGISPEIPVSAGSGSAILADGPVPASLDLAVGAVDTFTWTYTSASVGSLNLSSSAHGLTEGSAQVRTSLPGMTGDHEIFVPVTRLEVYSVTNMPFTLNRGQTDVVPLTLTFLLPELENSSSVNLSSLKLHLEDSDGLAIVPIELLDRVTVSEGVVTYLQKTDLETTGSEITLDFTTPIHVETGQPVSVALRLDISSTTNVSNFLVSIEDPSWFIGHDAVSGNPVPTVLQGGEFPIQSVAGTIVFEATGLEITSLPITDRSVGVGQNDVPMLSLELFNPGLSELGSTVLLNSLAFTLMDSEGTILANPGLTLDSVRVVGSGKIMFEAQPGAGDSSIIRLELPSAVAIPVNTRVVLEINGDIAGSAPTGPIHPRLCEPNDILARDGNSGDSVLVSYASEEINGPALQIEDRATLLMARCDPLLPSTLVIGAQGAKALTLTLRHPGGSSVAAILVDSLRIECRDDDRELISPDTLIDKLELWDGETLVSVIHDPSGGGIIALPLSGFLLAPGQTTDLELRVDFESTAQPSSIELVLGETDVFAQDRNLGTAITLTPESGEEFPLTSGLTRLQIPAEELTAMFEDLMPAVLTGSGGEIPVARLTLANPSGAETAAITLESLTLRASDLDYSIRPIGSWVEEILIYQDSEIWGSVQMDSPADTLAVITPSTESELSSGQVLILEVRMLTRSATATGGLRLGLLQEDISVLQQGESMSMIRVEPANGSSFPFWTEIGNFSVATLADSYSNFPNPFAAGREATTFVIQLPVDGTVTLRLMTAHWRPVFTIVDHEWRAAGLYQNDQWDGRNGVGVTVQNGVYVAELVVEYADGTQERHLRKVAVVR